MSRDLNNFVFKDSPPNPPARTKRTSPVIVTLGCLLLVIVLTCGGIAGFGYFAFHKMNDAQWGALNFFKALKGKNFKSAYAATSANFRSKMSQQQFEEFVTRYPLLSGHTGCGLQYRGPLFGQLMNRSTYQIKLSESYDPKRPFTGPSPDDDPTDKKTRQIYCTVVVVFQDGKWVVDAITVP